MHSGDSSMKCKTLACIFCLALLSSCGTEGTICEAGPCYLVGDYTQKELDATIAVENALVAAGFALPGYAINFIHSPDAPFKGTTWKNFRIYGVQPTDPDVGYGGFCDRELCMIWVNRCGSKEPHLHALLIHELLEAIGYHNGPEIRAEQRRVQEYLP